MTQTRQVTLDELLSFILSDLRAGHGDAALKRARDLTQRLPHHAKCWTVLAKCHVGVNQPGAVGYATRALLIDPQAPDNYLLLANEHMDRNAGTVDRYLRRGVLVGPDTLSVHDFAAMAERMTASFDRAQASARRPAILAPTRTHSWILQGNFSTHQGDDAAAARAYKRALMADPRAGQALYSLAMVAPDDVPAERLRDAGARCATGAVTGEQMELAAFAIALCLDRMNRTDDAMRWLILANREHRRRVQPQTQTNTQTAMLMINTAWTVEAAAPPAAPAPVPPFPTPIFIVGLPGSGTTLIESILSMHPAIEAGGELTFLDGLARTVDGYPTSVPSFSERERLDLAERYLSNLRTAVPGNAPFVTDKMPANFFHVGLIRALFPTAPIIHAVRDPMAVGWSLFRRRFSEGQSFAYDIDDIADHIAVHDRLMRHWTDLWPDTIMRVPYEALIDDTEARVRGLLAWLRLPWDPACLDFHRATRSISTASTLQVRRPINPAAKESWRRYERHLDPLRRALARYRDASANDAQPSG